MRVTGLDGLRKASGLAPRQFEIVERDAIRVSAIQMRHVMIEEVGRFAVGGAGGFFAQSIRYRASGLSATIGSLAPTAVSIEKGRSPGEVVPLGLIRRWVQGKGLVGGVFDIASRRPIGRPRRGAGLITAEETLVLHIVEQIRQHGTAPKLYGQRTAERSRDRVLRNFRESLQKALRGLTQIQRRAA